MRTRAHTVLLATALIWCLLSAFRVGAVDVPIKLIMHPKRAGKLTQNEVRAIYLKQRVLWNDGNPIIPINREAGSPARELFSERLFGQDSIRLATYWNQRYFEAGVFPPATLASDEAVIRFVANNENAIGYVAQEDVQDSVAVVLVLP